MKRSIVFLWIVLASLASFGQEENHVTDSISYRDVQRLALPVNCEDSADKDQLSCLLAELQKVFEQSYHIDSVGNVRNTETRKRVSFSFVVDQEGRIKFADAHAVDSDSLAIETVRVLNELELKPGAHHGGPVAVYYDFYLFVDLQKKELQVSCSENYDEVDTCSFAIIENAPIFPGCEKLATQLEKKRCFSRSVNRFVVKKFNVDIAQSLGLSPGKKRISIKFTIGKTGLIEDVMIRGPHRALERESRRVINLLPKMEPGLQRGKAVRVQFILPIVFEVIDDYPAKRKKKRRGLFNRW